MTYFYFMWLLNETGFGDMNFPFYRDFITRLWLRTDTLLTERAINIISINYWEED